MARRKYVIKRSLKVGKDSEFILSYPEAVILVSLKLLCCFLEYIENYLIFFLTATF